MSEAYQRFLDSLFIDHGKWKDEIGFDLDALRQMSAEERNTVETMLIKDINHGWRGIEALDAIGSDQAIDAMRRGLTSSNIEVRIECARKLKARGLMDEIEMETMIVNMLKPCSYNDFIAILERRLVKENPTPAVKRMLLWNTVNGDKIVRRPMVDFVYYLYGLSASPAFTYKGDGAFSAKWLWIRRRAFIKLCRAIGEDPSWVLSNTPNITSM